MIERYVDYMQFSALINEQECVESKYDIVFPIQFYTRGYRHPLGYRIYFGNPNSKKALVIASGDACQNMRDGDLYDSEIIQYALSLGGNFTRLDLAVTEYIEDQFVTIEEIEKWLSLGLIDSYHEKFGGKLISSVYRGGAKEHQTLYIGNMEKRGKAGIFRAYDKGVEMGIGNEIITRIELEERGEKAHNSAIRMAETNNLSGVFRSRFDVRSEDFARLMDSEAISTKRGKQRENVEHDLEAQARWDWLMKQVAPALLSAIQQDIAEGKGTYRLNQFLAKAGINKALNYQKVDLNRD